MKGLTGVGGDGLVPTDETMTTSEPGGPSWTNGDESFNRPETGDGDPPSAVTGAWRLELSPDALWWSPEMYEIFGVEPTTFSPSLESVYELMEPDSTARLMEQVERWREQPLPFAEAYRILRPDGDLQLVEVRGWTDVDDELRPRGILGTCRDVTGDEMSRRERLRLAQQQALILRAAGDGICGLDDDGRVSFCNPALGTLMRREGQPLTGQRLHDLVHHDIGGRPVHPLAECPFRSPDAARMSATDTQFHRGDGSRIEVGFVLTAVEEEIWRGAVISFRDITAARAASRLLHTSLQQVHSLSAQRAALLKALTDAEERERLRIAADIHDDTIQALGAVALRLSRAGEGADNDHDRDLLADGEIEVRGVADRLRKLMFELMPPLAGRDLRSSVETYCAVAFAETLIEYEIVGELDGLSSDRSLVAYRLIQEALRNALKHSHATRVQVSLEQTASELRFRVSDDGVGMGAGETPPTHAGLRIVRQRVEADGGSAHFGRGLDDRGSSIELRLPLSWREPR
jgi:signal transduction histidine kinase